MFREAIGGAPKVILLASGSELQLALEAAGRLEGEAIPTRVVSVLSWYLFEQQSQAYHSTVLPTAVTARVSVEAGITLGWQRWVGSSGRSVGIDHFGASAPWQRLYQEFGVTTEAVFAAALSALARK